MSKLKRMCMALATAAMMTAMTFSSIAATAEIPKVSLTVTSDIYADYGEGYVEVDTNTEGCYIDYDEVTFTNEPANGEWDEGDTPKIKVIVRAEDGYRFASGIKAENVTLNGPGKVTSISNSTKKVTVKITLPEVEYSDDYDTTGLEVSGLKWDKADGEGYWSRNYDAYRYEVKLYRDDEVIMDAQKTQNRRYDFTKYFTKKGTYLFKVRVIDEDGNRGHWKSSSEWYVSADTAKKLRGESTGTSGSTNAPSVGGPGTSAGSSASGPGSSATATQGAWIKDNTGWWWCNPDKTYPVSTWKQINGLWYYFNSAGYCVQNSWVGRDGAWYYCGENGDMVSSTWKQIKGVWYYLNNSGLCVQNGWVYTNGNYYYCGPSGELWTSRWTPDGYWVNSQGIWVR